MNRTCSSRTANAARGIPRLWLLLDAMQALPKRIHIRRGDRTAQQPLKQLSQKYCRAQRWLALCCAHGSGVKDTSD